MDEKLKEEFDKIQCDVAELNARVDRFSMRLADYESQGVADSDGILEEPASLQAVATEMPIVKVDCPYYRPKQKGSYFGKLEGNLGQYAMGVFASLLIFAGLGSFVFLEFESLTNVLKVFIMSGFSCLILGLALWYVKVSKNAFSVSVTGCGVGCLYISLLTAYIHFGLISQIVFFLFLALWASITLLVSIRLKSDSFGVIGSLGLGIALAIALLFGGHGSHSLSDLTVLILFYSVFYPVYLLTGKKLYSIGTNTGILALCILSNALLVFSIRDCVSLEIPCYSKISPLFLIMIFYLFVFNALFCVYIMQFIRGVGKKENFPNFISVLGIWVMTLLSCLLVGVVIKPISLTFDYSHFSSIVIVLLAIVLMEKCRLIEYVKTGRDILFVLFTISLGYHFSDLGAMTNVFGLSLLFIPLLGYGFFLKDEMVKILGNIVLFVSVCFGFLYSGAYDDSVLSVEFILFTLIHLLSLCGYYVLLGFKRFYHCRIKIFLYVTSIIFFFYSMSVIFDLSSVKDPLVYGLLAVSIFSLGCLISSFCYDWREKIRFLAIRTDILYREESSYILIRVMNLLFMIFTLIYISLSSGNEFLKFVCVLLTTVQCTIGTKEIMGRAFGRWSGFYLGIKFTIYLNWILYSYITYSDFAYFGSTLCIVLAILAIILGFKLDLESFRHYGLFLSLISVLKLILIDINYENSMGRVFSFIGGGILCFVIVWIYNHMFKQVKK